MTYRLVTTLFLLAAMHSAVRAMTVQLTNADSPGMPNATCINDGSSSCQILLQLVNDADAEVHILAWQLDLSLIAEAGAQGSLVFEELLTPTDPLFGTTPGPLPLLMSDSNVQAIDGDLESLAGQPIPAAAPRNIVQFVLQMEPTTVGTFSLQMLNYNPTDDSGSSWFDGDLLLPQAFTNPMGSPDSLFIGTITVLPVPEPASATLLLLGGLLLRLAVVRRHP